MKKTILLAVVAVLCAAGFAGYKAYDNYVIGNESKLMLKNVEALTGFEEAFQEAYNAMYDAIAGTVSDRCPGGEQSCSDVTAELSIPGWASISVTFYFYRETR